MKTRGTRIFDSAVENGLTLWRLAVSRDASLEPLNVLASRRQRVTSLDGG